MAEQETPPHGTNQIALAIAEIENILRASGAMTLQLPREAESVLMHQFGHFFYLGQMSSRALIEDMRIELAQMHTKLDMMAADLKELTIENHVLRRQVEALSERK